MFLRRLCIKNYKSLKNVEFCPTNLSVLVGPNGAGKSNFASAVDFLSDVYRDGLETAVARKGGYDNIAYRAERRSRSGIRFEVTIELDSYESMPLGVLHSIPESVADEGAGFRLTHRFAFRAANSGIEADFAIEQESLDVRVKRAAGSSPEDWPLEVELLRSEKGRVTLKMPRDAGELAGLRDDLDAEVATINRLRRGLAPQQLFAVVRSFAYVDDFTRRVANWRVLHIVPSATRSPSVQTPNPFLSLTGQNLASVVGWLKKYHKPEWFEVMQTMLDVVPELEDIEASYLHAKRLGLFFKESTSSTPRTAEDVSDGTIHALSLLVALADPRNTALVIEEVENAFHPWVVQTLLKRFRLASRKKTIIVTTHSPVVVDTLDPSETWVVFKKAGQTRLKNLGSMDRKLRSAWERGEFRLSDYLDSGLLPQAVPGGDL